MIVTLDGTPLRYPNSSLTKPQFKLQRQDEAGEKVLSYAGDLEFYGEDAAYLRLRLVDDPYALSNWVELRFIDDCCPGIPPKVFQIKPEGLEWCEMETDCSVRATAVEYSQSSEQYNCIKSTLIWDNHAGFQQQQHPRITYCNEFRPAILQDAMILLLLFCDNVMIALIPLFSLVAVLITTINLIITAVNLLCGNCLNTIGDTVDGGAIQWAINFFQNFNSKFIGCGRKHPSPLVRDYVNNVCSKCGLTFQSSIWNSPSSDYYNTVYFNAPVRKGVDATDTTTYWIDDNKPLLNGYKLLNDLRPPVNGEWRIENNVLKFERRDYFQTTTPWLDTRYLPEGVLVKECYQWSQKERPAYANLQYMQDAVDWVGDEARQRWGDIVEWNNPYNPTQKGEYLLQLTYGAARFRDDGIDRDVLSSYSGWPIVGGIIQAHGRVMLMNNGTAFMPKLLIWDDTTPRADARVRLYYPPGNTNAGLNQHYNYPFWFDQSTPGNLYDRAYAIENPRNAGYIGQDVDVELSFDCAILAAVNVDGTIQTRRGIAEVRSIEIDYNQSRMVIKGQL
jgi:hypothetical protein